jgi:hypothetical protein
VTFPVVTEGWNTRDPRAVATQQRCAEPTAATGTGATAHAPGHTSYTRTGWVALRPAGMALGKLGAAIRPKSFRDEDEAAKRGKVWVCGVVALLVILGLILMCAATQRVTRLCGWCALANPPWLTAIPSQVP